MTFSGFPGPESEQYTSYYEKFIKQHGLIAFLNTFTLLDWGVMGNLYRAKMKYEHPEWKDKIRLWEILNKMEIS